MSNKVKIIDNLSGVVLFETNIENLESAYSYAAELEEQGLDISITAPGLAESLIQSLGANDQEIKDYKKSLDEEIDSHEEIGCSVCPPQKNTTH
jgi:hypothetical protein